MGWELELTLGLVFPASVCNLRAETCGVAFCGDASTKGYAMAAAGFGDSSVRDATRYRERWRFKRVEREFDEPGVRRRAEAYHPTAGFGQQLMRRLGVPLDSCRPRPTRQAPVAFEEVEVVGRVLAPTTQEMCSGRWRLLLRGAWLRDEAIH